MRINSLQLFQFRNYKDLTLDLQPEIIVLYGTNGAGKTNILEAIYVGTIGKSHRTMIRRICFYLTLMKRALW